MPLTPLTWRDQFIVNTGTLNTQNDPDIIQLANGSIVVSWTTSGTAGLGSPDGTETFAQIFNPFGVAVGGEIRLNGASITDDEENADLAAFSSGFIAVYHDVDLPASVPAGASNIRIETFNASGVSQSNVLLVNDTGLGGDPNYRNPVIAVASATSALVTYETVTGGVSAIVGKLYNPTTLTLGSELFLINLGGGNVTPDVVALSNGNYVIAARNTSADTYIAYRIIDAAGLNVLSASTITSTNTNGTIDTDPTVTALAGGGFVISWVNTGVDTDVGFRVYNAAGTQTGAGAVGVGSITNNNNEPRVIGLPDGGFIVVYDNDELNTVDVQRFSSTGAEIGAAFSFSGQGAQLSATALADGRFAIAWVGATAEIELEILDTRDLPNTTAVYATPTFVGTVANDIVSGLVASELINGWTGDDLLAGGGGADTIFGDAGNDFIIGGNGVDSMSGGVGFDAVSWLGQPLGVTVNLLDQAANAGQAAGEVVSGFEAYYLTDNADSFTADANGGYIFGFGGADVIFGGSGTDIIDGGIGGDFINGLGGFDYANYSSSLVGLTIVLANQAQNLGAATGDTITNVEAFYLTAQADSFTGQSGQNFVFAGEGTDFLFGGANANDWLFGEGGADLISGGNFDDLLSGGAGNDTYAFASWVGNGFDSILDFESVQDKFQLTGSGFGLAPGTIFTAGVNFIAAGSPFANSAQGTILYATGLGILYYDPDGSGAGAAIALAQIANAPAMAPGDFVVV